MSATATADAVRRLHEFIVAGDAGRAGEAAKAGGRAVLEQAHPESGYAALTFACVRHADAAVLSALLKTPSAVDVKHEDGETALYAAAFNRLPEHVKLLLAAGAKADTDNGPDRETALHAAARLGYVNVADALLKGGADINAANARRETPLFAASRQNRFEMVYYLLTAGAGKHAVDRDGRSALYIASECRHKHIVALLQAEARDLRHVKAAAEVEMRSEVPALGSAEAAARREAAAKEQREVDALFAAKAPSPPPAAPSNSAPKTTASATAAKGAASPKSPAEPSKPAPKAATPTAAPAPVPKAAPAPVTEVPVAPVPVPVPARRAIRTHDPFTGQALGPCRTLDEVGPSPPPEVPAALQHLPPVEYPRTGGTMMVVGTGTFEDGPAVQPPNLAEGDLEPDGPIADAAIRRALAAPTAAK